MITEFPDDLMSNDEVVHADGARTVALLGGAVILAVNDTAGGGVLAAACATSEIEARRRASDAWRIRRAMRVTPSVGASAASPTALSLDDFVLNRGRLPDGPVVDGRGLISSDDYEVPLGVVAHPASRASLVCSQPGALGCAWLDDTTADAESTRAALEDATARIVGQDIVSRWWHGPEHREPPTPVPADDLGGPYQEIARALRERGLSCSCYFFSISRPVALTVISRPDGSESTFGISTHSAAPAAAAENSLCDALYARLALLCRRSAVIEPLDLARIATGWQIGGAMIRQLRRITGPDVVPSLMAGRSWSTDSWSELAISRFDHEPVVVDWPTQEDGHAVRVLCPGAAVYRRTDECVPCPA